MTLKALFSSVTTKLSLVLFKRCTFLKDCGAVLLKASYFPADEETLMP